ncbi:MAG: hypothetical protein GY829_00945 [Gammaproteobacteria bacterium]|nr:hypothetical protein [Gammaproteobacteria bacterium]
MSGEKFTPGEYQTTSLSKVFVGGDFANRTADVISAVEDRQLILALKIASLN